MSKLEISPEVLAALQKLSRLLESDEPLQATFDCIAQLPVEAINGCDAAGVSLRVDKQVSTVAASDGFALEIDNIQYDTKQGPCLSALDSGEFREIKRVTEETRWREFCVRAEAKGFGSNLSFPLRMNGSLGALNIYAKKELAFDERSVEIGGIFARQANIALQNAQMYKAALGLADKLNEAIQTRDTIGQAKGILMEREGISDEEAFAMLRTISQGQNIKLREVARMLIQEKLQHLPGGQEAGPPRLFDDGPAHLGAFGRASPPSSSLSIRWFRKHDWLPAIPCHSVFGMSCEVQGRIGRTKAGRPGPPFAIPRLPSPPRGSRSSSDGPSASKC